MSALTLLGGCSSGVSRFDFPSFGLTRSEYRRRSPIRTPPLRFRRFRQESVYASAPGNPGRLSEQLSERLVFPLEPAAGIAALYSGDARRLFAANRESEAASGPPTRRRRLAPRPNLAKVRAATGPGAGGEIYKVQAGDTPRSIAAEDRREREGADRTQQSRPDPPQGSGRRSTCRRAARLAVAPRPRQRTKASQRLRLTSTWSRPPRSRRPDTEQNLKPAAKAASRAHSGGRELRGGDRRPEPASGKHPAASRA